MFWKGLEPPRPAVTPRLVQWAQGSKQPQGPVLCISTGRGGEASQVGSSLVSEGGSETTEQGSGALPGASGRRQAETQEHV